MPALRRWMVTVLIGGSLAAATPEPSREASMAADHSRVNPVIRNVERTVLHGNIAHYRYDVRVGRGQFDVIRLHRVVKEHFPYRPVRTVDGVMFLPGTPNYFETVFMAPLISPGTAWDHSLVAFLAKNDVDVWGMDYGWALAPAETTDFHFLKGWGLSKDIEHSQIALAFARTMRGITGQGMGPIHLGGLCSGGAIAYAIAGEETQRPHLLRSVKGIIPIEIGMRYPKEGLRDSACSAQGTDQANLDAGRYNDETGLFLKQLGDLALSAPGEASPIPDLGGINNYQAGLFFGTSNELLTGQFWHFVGGYLDEFGIPSGLRYSPDQLWLNLLQNLPPNYPMQVNYDLDAMFCGKTSVPFDDHLNRIAVPILHVGAGGGFGEVGFYTTTLTASQDVRKVMVQLSDQHQIDFGHVDTLLGTNAESLVWKPVLDWIVAHR